MRIKEIKNFYMIYIIWNYSSNAWKNV